jgi:hypothetical protein
MTRTPLLLAALAGCATSTEVTMRVDDASWKRLADVDRLTVTMKDEPELGRARDEEKRATQGLADARRSVENDYADRASAKEAIRRARDARAAAHGDGDPHVFEQAQVELKVAEEGERVAVAKSAWLDAQVVWRERAVEAAHLRVSVTDAKLELDKVEQFNQRNLGETIDPLPYRHQHGQLMGEWVKARKRMVDAHGVLDQRARALADGKTRYAQVRQVVLPAPKVAPAPPPTITDQ